MKAGMSPERLRHIAHLAEGWVAQRIHPALVILVARKGKIVLHEASRPGYSPVSCSEASSGGVGLRSSPMAESTPLTKALLLAVP